MSDNVIKIGVTTPLDILEEAKGIVTGGVIVLGFDSNGDFYGASTIPFNSEVIWLLEVMKHKIITGEPND